MACWRPTRCVFFFKQKTSYEMRISDWIQTCALPIFVGATGQQREVDSSALAAAAGAMRKLQRHSSGQKQGLPELHVECSRLGLDAIGQQRRTVCEIGRASCRERVGPYV